MAWQMRGFFSVVVLNCLQARHWVGVNYNIVLYHVSIISQWLRDDSILSSKYGAVIKEPFGQLVASHLALVIDERYCTHPFICEYLIPQCRLHYAVLRHCDIYYNRPKLLLLWLYNCSLLQWSRVSSDRIHVFQGDTFVSSGSRPSCVNLCRGHGFLYLETDGIRVRVMPLSFGLRRYRSLMGVSNSYRPWCTGLSS